MTIMSDDDFVREFQARGGLDPVDGVAGRDTLALLDRVFPEPQPPATVAVAANNEIPDDYWPMLSRIESADDPYVKARTSSGSGAPTCGASAPTAKRASTMPSPSFSGS